MSDTDEATLAAKTMSQEEVQERRVQRCREALALVQEQVRDLSQDEVLKLQTERALELGRHDAARPRGGSQAWGERRESLGYEVRFLEHAAAGADLSEFE